MATLAILPAYNKYSQRIGRVLFHPLPANGDKDVEFAMLKQDNYRNGYLFASP